MTCNDSCFGLVDDSQSLLPLSLVFQVDLGLNYNVLAGTVVRITTGVEIVCDREIIGLDEVQLQYAHVVLVHLTANDFDRHDLV